MTIKNTYNNMFKTRSSGLLSTLQRCNSSCRKNNTHWHWKINKARNTNTWEIVGNKLYAGALQWETVTEGFPKVIVVSRRVYQDCLCIHPCMTWWFYPSHAFGEGSPFTISTNRQICVHPPCHTPIISLFTHHFSYILWLIKDTKIWLYKNIHFP